MNPVALSGRFPRIPRTHLASTMSVEEHYKRYRELQAYVGWIDEDAARLKSVAALVAPFLERIVDDFYEEIERHPSAASVITGGAEQVKRLKGTLLRWVTDLFTGDYGPTYVERRWQVGRRHVEIGLDQAYTNAALSRIRGQLLLALHESWPEGNSVHDLMATGRALNRLLDLDLAMIEDAYQDEHARRQQRIERLATIGQIAGGIAHELRNPLNVVKTSVYYLLNARSATAEKKEEHLRRIERHVELADGVISTLSNFAKMPTPQATSIAIAPRIREAIEVNPTGPAINLVLDLPDDLPPVSADGDQLLIVFGNLVRNARDAMARGGTLSIKGRAHGAHVEISVEDTGIGIPKEDLVRIMEPLYTTKARGLGLGLAIVRAILDKNRGELRVASTPGHGSVFTVRLTAATSDDSRGGVSS